MNLPAYSELKSAEQLALFSPSEHPELRKEKLDPDICLDHCCVAFNIQDYPELLSSE